MATKKKTLNEAISQALAAAGTSSYTLLPQAFEWQQTIWAQSPEVQEAYARHTEAKAKEREVVSKHAALPEGWAGTWSCDQTLHDQQAHGGTCLQCHGASGGLVRLVGAETHEVFLLRRQQLKAERRSALDAVCDAWRQVCVARDAAEREGDCPEEVCVVG